MEKTTEKTRTKTNIKATPTDNIENSVIDWAGEAPKGPFVWTGKWTNAWGKNKCFRFWGTPDRTIGCVYDHRDQTKQTFYLKTSSKRIKLPVMKSAKVSAEADFKALSKVPQDDHPYFKKKEITAKGLNVRWLDDKVVIPVYSTEGQVISWQTIDKHGGKFFKKDHPLGHGHHFPIGTPTERVFVCEGLATGVSIHNITKAMVYCAFSRGNLDHVSQHCLKKYPKAEVVLALDNDGENTHKTKVKDKRLWVIKPLIPKGQDKSDFNDVQSSKYEQAKLHTLDPLEARLLTSRKAEDIKIIKPTSFYENILLHYEFNFLFGSGKIGKTRGLLWLIAKALKNFEGKKCAILSTENDDSTMLAPLLRELVALDRFELMDNKIQKDFKPGAKGYEKIPIFLERLRKYLYLNKIIDALLLDPLPRFLDWNNETLACLMIDGLRDIAKEYKVCIMGVRNEGKNRAYETEALYKGSSVIGDNTRQVIRAVKCHKRSVLGKEFPKEKTFVIYTELSSLYGEQGFFFRLEKVVTKKEGHTLVVPKLVRQMDHSADDIKYLSSRESGQSLTNKIFTYISKTPQKGCTLEDLYNEFCHIHDPKLIRNAVYKYFDTAKVSGVPYVQLKGEDKSATEDTAHPPEAYPEMPPLPTR